MAFNYSPKIVTDGLVLCLDAANTKSYVSGSTTWNDVSRGGNSGTLTNGPTFNNANGGSIVFDGSDDYISGNNISTLFTDKVYASVFYKLTSTVSYPMVLTVGKAVVNNEGFSIRHDIGTGNPQLTISTSGTTAVITNSVSVLNTNVCIGLLYDGATIKLYKNGIFTGDSTPKTGNIAFGISPIYRVGAREDGFYFSGNIYNVQIYNRALSDQEILRNYNATKTRFGL